jgi:hypothetical protein
MQSAAQDLHTPADLSVPDSPAFTALGVTPQTVSRPAAPMTFATSLLNAVDDQGKLQNGLAVDFTPYLVFHGHKVTITQYRAWSVWRRAFALTNVSLATTKRTDSDNTQRLSGGVHFTVFDIGDPRMDTALLDCYDKIAMSLLPTPEVPADAPTFTSMTSAAVSRCAEEAAKRNRNRSSLIVAAAPVWVTATGEVSDLTDDGGAIWASFAYGFDRFKRVRKVEDLGKLAKRAQFIVHARWRANERIKGEDGTVAEHDRRIIGARFRMTGERMNGSIELSHLDDSTSYGDSSKWRALIGLEHRVAEGAWLNVSFGREISSDGENEQLVVRSSIRWAFNGAPTIR